MVYWPRCISWTPWSSPTHRISNQLTRVNWTPYRWEFDPPSYPWYIECLTHGNMNRLSYALHFEPSIHGISNHLIHGILTPLQLVYQIRYTWYFEPSTHDILNPLSVVCRPPCLSLDYNPLFMVYQTQYPWYSDPYYSGVQYTIARWFDIPWVGRKSQNIMGKTVLYTMVRAFEIPRVGGSICHL
jgi:hypothetical protein